MSRLYLHLHECGVVTPDEEGMEAALLERARAAAIEGARDIMIGEMKEGRLCLSCHIEITDEAGHVLEVVPFTDAVAVSLPH